jgi:hypothetical protein
VPLRYRIPRIPRTLWLSVLAVLAVAGVAAATGFSSPIADELPPIAASDAELAEALQRSEGELEWRPEPTTRRHMLRRSSPVAARQSYGEGGFWIFAGDNRMPASDHDAALAGAASERAGAWPGREVVFVAGCCESGAVGIDFVLRPRAPKPPSPMYDKVTELDLDAARGRLLLVANGDAAVENAVDVPGGRYRARISRADAAGGEQERMLVELWRVDEQRRPPTVVR